MLDPVRYLVICVRQRQGGLFEDGSLTRHYAVVTNRFDFDGKRLLEWLSSAKIRSALRSLLLQPVFVMQPAEHRRRWD